jgi:hypothetical protein
MLENGRESLAQARKRVKGRLQAIRRGRRRWRRREAGRMTYSAKPVSRFRQTPMQQVIWLDLWPSGVTGVGGDFLDSSEAVLIRGGVRRAW